MKALTICQPYAELIARGDKVIENRTWFTSFRGPIAIHAGKSLAWLEPEDGTTYPDMAFGAVIATARLIDCVRVEKLPAHLADNEHANGPWCWLLADVKRLDTPRQVNGAQGLWELTDPAERETQEPPT